MTVTVTASQKAKTSAATPVHSAASQSMQESLFSSSGVSHDSASASAEARSDKDRLKGEDNDEDDSSAGNNSSESSSEMMSSAAAAARLSAAALLVGLSCAAFF
ncbi:hypothetical protein LPJ81_004452 [Coemansia sp. IMI 209127]|nr:hypothetical protein LPJ81_004452 [Coemansia sp. IMI 209127]